MLLSMQKVHAAIGEKPILRGIDLEIGEGEVHVVMGPNGSGKSTLANVIMHTGGYTLTDGKIFFHGEDITEDTADKRARAGLFMSYQSPVAIPGVTVEAFLRAAIQARDGEMPGFFEVRDRMEECMDALGIPHDVAQRYVNVGFSGGERKKLEILQLLMLDPDLAILDETDSGLDVDAVNVVGRGIEKFLKTPGKSLLVITHHHEILQHVQCDRVHVIVEGKIAAEGDASLMQTIDRDGFGFLRRAHGQENASR